MIKLNLVVSMVKRKINVGGPNMLLTKFRKILFGTRQLQPDNLTSRTMTLLQKKNKKKQPLTARYPHSSAIQYTVRKRNEGKEY